MATALGAQLMLAVGAVTANVVTAVLLSEVFPTAVRYTASAITYNVSYALFGGTAPFVATFLIAQTGNQLAPAIYIVVIAVGAFVASMLLPETNGKTLPSGSGKKRRLRRSELSLNNAREPGNGHLKQGAASNSAEVAPRTKHSDPGSCFELTARLP